MYGLPDDLKIDVAVVVNDAVAHADNLGERDAGKLGAGFGIQASGGFPGHEETPQNGVLCLGVLEKLLVRLLPDVGLSRRYATCLGGIDITGRFED